MQTIAQAITGGKTPKPRTALYTDFLDEHGNAIDNGILLYFAAPASFTGEDVIELQGHGGQIVLPEMRITPTPPRPAAVAMAAMVGCLSVDGCVDNIFKLKGNG